MADMVVGRDKCGEQRLVSLPLSRIRVIMKSSPEVSSINQEALVLTAKATVRRQEGGGWGPLGIVSPRPSVYPLYNSCALRPARCRLRFAGSRTRTRTRTPSLCPAPSELLPSSSAGELDAGAKLLGFLLRLSRRFPYVTSGLLGMLGCLLSGPREGGHRHVTRPGNTRSLKAAEL